MHAVATSVLLQVTKDCMQQQLAEVMAQLHAVETEHDQLTGRNAVLEKVLHSHQLQLEILHDHQQVLGSLLAFVTFKFHPLNQVGSCTIWHNLWHDEQAELHLCCRLHRRQRQQQQPSLNPQWQGQAPTRSLQSHQAGPCFNNQVHSLEWQIQMQPTLTS